jgi:hypothetical protein
MPAENAPAYGSCCGSQPNYRFSAVNTSNYNYLGGRSKMYVNPSAAPSTGFLASWVMGTDGGSKWSQVGWVVGKCNAATPVLWTEYTDASGVPRQLLRDELSARRRPVL